MALIHASTQTNYPRTKDMMVHQLQTIHDLTACIHDPTVKKERPKGALCGGAPSAAEENRILLHANRGPEYPLDLCVGPKRTCMALSRDNQKCYCNTNV